MRQRLHDNSNKQSSPLPSSWLFYVIALVGITILLLLWYAFVLQSQMHTKRIIRMQVNEVTTDVKVQLQHRILTLQHMSKHLAEGIGSKENNWSDIKEYAQSYGGFFAIAWFDETFKPRWIDSKNMPSANTMISNFAKQYSVQATQELKHSPVWISSAISLPPNDKGSFIVVPIGESNKVTGYFVVIVNFNAAFDFELNPEDYSATIYLEDQKVFQNNPTITATPSVNYLSNFSLYNKNWKVYVEPSPDFLSEIQTHLSSVALILGSSIAALFLLTIRLAQIARIRAKEVAQVNENLKIEIKERTHAEETKQKLEKALLQGQKLQAIGTLAGGIAHDFNNLLYAIIGYAEMAQEDSHPNGPLYNNLSKVLEAARRGQELISRILAFGRRQHNELKPVILRSTIDSVFALLRPTVPASITINYQITIPDDFTILGDQTRIHQVLVNIINNAVDAMDGEGTVDIHIEPVEVTKELLQQFPSLTEKRYCKIEIADTGHGMDQSTLERIFEPFYTTKEVGKGTGLGLATVHTIIKEHQGEITVKSKLGFGTTFTILLPEYLYSSNDTGR